MMGLAIELYFDQESEDKLFGLWQALMDFGIQSNMVEIQARPHVSLAVFSAREPTVLHDGLADFAKNVPPFSLQFSSVASFPTDEGVVYIAPVVTKSLLVVHERCHTWLQDEEVERNGYYLPGNWVPHCTVAIHLPENLVGTAVAFCRQYQNAFRTVHAKSVGLVEVGPGQEAFSQVKEIYVFNLAQPSGTVPH